jgi:hypothetical protein
MTVSVPDDALSATRSELAEFFLVFARFEFALKASGYAKQGRWGAEVDWCKFADEISPALLPPKSKELQDAVTYLSGEPPQQQTWSDNQLGWAKRTPPADWSEMRVLLFYVQGARNNLVHGAKFVARESQDPDRDHKLLLAASCVIDHCLQASERVHRGFYSGAL